MKRRPFCGAINLEQFSRKLIDHSKLLLFYYFTLYGKIYIGICIYFRLLLCFNTESKLRRMCLQVVWRLSLQRLTIPECWSKRKLGQIVNCLKMPAMRSISHLIFLSNAFKLVSISCFDLMLRFQQNRSSRCL